jgi:hypothetical protein
MFPISSDVAQDLERAKERVVENLHELDDACREQAGMVAGCLGAENMRAVAWHGRPRRGPLRRGP